MSILDIAASVITTYRADVSDMKSAIKGLKGDQKDLAQAELDAANARNEQLDKWADGLGKVESALGKVKAVADFLWEGMKLKQQETRLETAALGIDIERLSASFGGLKTRMEVLQFAQRANNTEFKLTNDQLNTIAAATRTLTERGFDATEVQNAFTTAMVTGKTKGLMPYGFQLNDMAGSINLVTDKLTPLEKAAQKVNDVMGFAGKLSGDAGKGMGAFGEDADRAAVKLKDSWSSMKQSLSGLGEQMVPLVTALGQAVGYIAQLVAYASKLPSWAGGLDSGSTRSTKWNLMGGAGFQLLTGDSDKGPGDGQYLVNAAATLRDQKILADQASKILDEQFKAAAKAFGSYMETTGKGVLTPIVAATETIGTEAKKQEQAMRDAAASAAKALSEKIRAMVTKSLTDAGEEFLKANDALPGDIRSLNPGRVGAYAPSYTVGSFGLYGAPMGARRDGSTYGDARNVNVQLGALAGNDLLGNSLAQGGGPDAFGLNKQFAGLQDQWKVDDRNKGLAKIFGPVSDFEVYKKAFDGLTSAVTAGLNAWISGSESAGAAIKKALGGAIQAVADQMLVESLKNAAYAVGQFALFLGTGDPKAAASATAYGAAAAEFAAGAAVAAVVAKSLGGSASTAGGGKSTAPGGGVPTTSPNGTGAAPAGVTIVYGDSFANDSPRRQAVRARQLIGKALGTSGGIAA